MKPVPPTTAASPAPAARHLAHLWASLTPRRIAINLVVATVAAIALNPIFETPFLSVWGRSIFVGLMLLVAFDIAGHWPSRWLPRWVVQVAAVVVTAPVATLVAYLVMVQGDVTSFQRNEGLLWGFFSIATTGLAVGLTLALGALYRERDAQARSQALAFALERSTLEKQALDARLRLLHAQVEPHFLFNTLANVQQLVESGSERAGPVLKSLIAYLRAAVPSLAQGSSTLGHEIGLVRAYLDLMRMRMPDRLAFEVSMPPALAELPFPPMALLTLVENAVRHGIDPSETGGRIEVGARADAQQARVEIWVRDTGAGLDEKAVPGTGLANLRERLKATYGDAAQLQLADESPHGLRATLLLPDPRPDFDGAAAAAGAAAGTTR
ncbi:histidine kinase [Rhizobacter sp. SG703]|uniref:sensor histidine kinase n=1 Tax=Rhizobacter sp. SG703 TaxID=2587140 RepID=UPI001448273A|nr:histidine kinase [Rhizobacter sp. SG703]NKI92779.1 signal transduction histidine kinase [Rhizobacter sp. SG703]